MTRRPSLEDLDAEEPEFISKRLGRWKRMPDGGPESAGYRPLPLGIHGGCWCGGPPGHDWSGKDAGKPHPRQEGQQ